MRFCEICDINLKDLVAKNYRQNRCKEFSSKHQLQNQPQQRKNWNNCEESNIQSKVITREVISIRDVLWEI